MDQAILRRSIEDWGRYLRVARDQLRPRALTLSLPARMGLALIGVRRCGKTYSAIQLSSDIPDDNILYYNFEDPAFVLDSDLPNLDQLLTVAAEIKGRAPRRLILDEIQNVPRWERWLRKILDQREYEVIVTGSSARLLSRELATAVAGRCLEERVWPLSFSEYLSFTDRSPQRPTNLIAGLADYLQWGGFPEVVMAPDAATRLKILRQYLSDIMFRDVLQRSDLRNRRALMQVATYYLTNLSSQHSYSAIKNAFGIGIETAELITRSLADAFLIFEVSRYHPNLKVQARDPKKIYVVDSGLRNVGARSPQDDRGKLLENAVFVELMRRGNEVSYFKGARETDFVITEAFKPVQAIQVCASDMSDAATASRELAGMQECLTSLNLAEGTIVTWDRAETITQDGKRIHLIPAYVWLRKVT